MIPSVVFSVEEEIRAYDGHAHGHDDQNSVDQQHEPCSANGVIGSEYVCVIGSAYGADQHEACIRECVCNRE